MRPSMATCVARSLLAKQRIGAERREKKDPLKLALLTTLPRRMLR